MRFFFSVTDRKYINRFHASKKLNTVNFLIDIFMWILILGSISWVFPPHLCIPSGLVGWTESEDLLSNSNSDTSLSPLISLHLTGLICKMEGTLVYKKVGKSLGSYGMLRELPSVSISVAETQIGKNNSSHPLLWWGLKDFMYRKLLAHSRSSNKYSFPSFS